MLTSFAPCAARTAAFTGVVSREAISLAVANRPGAELLRRIQTAVVGTTAAWVRSMSKLLRGVAAGWGAKKLGGGCLSTILVFVILWYLLGNFQIFR